MRLPDSNVVIYAFNSAASQHQAAREWFGHALSGTEPVGFSWLVLLAFLRLSTNPVAVPNPLRAEQALDVVDSWLAQPNARIIDPTERHAAILRELIEAAGTAGNLTTDSHLAALAIEHGATLATFDGDFHRFESQGHLCTLGPVRGLGEHLSTEME